MTLEKLSKHPESLRTISFALIFELKMFSSRIFSLPKFLASHFEKKDIAAAKEIGTGTPQGNQT